MQGGSGEEKSENVNMGHEEMIWLRSLEWEAEAVH